MLIFKKENQLKPKDKVGKQDFTKNLSKSRTSHSSDLNVIIENEEKLKNNKKEQEEHYSDEESLGYKSNYKLNQNNKTNQDCLNIQEDAKKRKSSTLSTAMSQNEIYAESNSFLPQKNKNSERKTSCLQTQLVFYGLEKINSPPIFTYFEGLDIYLRQKQPEKSIYKKTKNYIEKKIFYGEKNILSKDSKYKSFDLSEEQKLKSSQILKNLEEKEINKASPTTINIENNIYYNNVNINSTSNVNNNISSFTPIVGTSFNGNSFYGKYDPSMYYVGYYNVDYCKYIYNLILIFC